MRIDLLIATALSLVLVAGSALAQTPESQKPEATTGKPPHTTSGPGQTSAQPEGKGGPRHGDTAGPTPETGSAMGRAPSSPDSSGSSTGMSQTPGESQPAKQSTDNAAKDDRWWLDRTYSLTSEDKQKIFASVKAAQPTPGIDPKLHASPSVIVAPVVRAQDFPEQIKREVPLLMGLKYFKTENQVLLVEPSNNIVVGVIGQ